MSEETDSTLIPTSDRFPATVADVIDPYTVVINRGKNDGVRVGQLFLIYAISDKVIIDPETLENLGVLETVRGQGEVVSVQEKLAVIRSNKWRKVDPKSIELFLYALRKPPELAPLKDAVLEMYRDPKVGDKARRL